MDIRITLSNSQVERVLDALEVIVRSKDFVADVPDSSISLFPPVNIDGLWRPFTVGGWGVGDTFIRLAWYGTLSIPSRAAILLALLESVRHHAAGSGALERIERMMAAVLAELAEPAPLGGVQAICRQGCPASEVEALALSFAGEILAARIDGVWRDPAGDEWAPRANAYIITFVGEDKER